MMNLALRISILFFAFASLSNNYAQPAISDLSIGDGFIRTGNVQQAVDYYTKVLLYEPNNTDALIKRAHAYSLLGNFSAADADLTLANNSNPFLGVYLKPSFRSELLKSKNYNYNSDEDGAFNKSLILREEYQKILELDQSKIEIDTLLELALISILNENFEDAEFYLSQKENEDHTSALYYDLAGLVALKSENYDLAVENFLKAVNLNADLVPVYHNLAIAYKKLGDFEASEKAFETALAKNATISNIHFGKANLLLLQNENDKASYYYQKAIEISENYYQAMANYSVLLKATGDYRLALTEIEQSIRANPSAIENYYIRGGLHFIYGEYDKAIKDYDEYLLTFKNDKDALFNRGVSKILAQNTQSGCLDISDAIDAGYDENNVDIYYFFCD